MTVVTQSLYLRLRCQMRESRARKGIGVEVCVEDGDIVDYLNNLYELGHHSHVGEKVVAALLFETPGLAARVPRTLRALKGFRRLAPHRSRRPFPRAMWMGLACELCAAGHVQMAVWICVGLSAYLRPGENMALRKCDAVRPALGMTNHWSVIIAPSDVGLPSKTGDTDDSVILDSDWIVPWIGDVLACLTQGDPLSPLWNFTYAELSKEAQRVAHRFGVSLVLHQLRGSGASDDRLRRTRPLEEVQKRGRWRAYRSVTRYERAGRVGQAANEFSSSLSAFLVTCESVVGVVILGLA